MWYFDPRTVRLLVSVVAPDASEASRIARAAEQDPRLLASILQEPRLHAWLLERPHEMVTISPHAFFAALLYRVRMDLATRAFTHERDSGRLVVVFDIERIRELLAVDEVVAYLSWILASFVRINAETRTVRVRQSAWRKVTVSDYDIGSLVGYVRRLAPPRRPVIYRRIGEVALFQRGVFSESPQPTDLVQLGTDSYRRALDGGAATPEEVGPMEAVSEAFIEAAKAYTFMTDHYLGALRTHVFVA